MSYILIIVESPGKIQKLSHILGDKYKICASVGHIMDLDEKEFSIDINNNYEPKYVINKDKISVIKNIKELYKNASEVYLAGDMDREGQMINWSLSQILKIKNPMRITFSSITKTEILEAIKNPQSLNENLINAQKTRRILDRIIGYKLSHPLSRQLKTNASAGRVMSVVVKLIIDKEKEIEDKIKNIKSNYKYEAKFISDNKKIINDSKLYYKKKNEIVKIDEKNARELFDILIKSNYIVNKIDISESKTNPSPPFTTSSMLQEAKKKLGFTSKKTMTAAQNLYENGKITYMRTDSVSMSKEAMCEIKQFIMNKFGEKFYKYCNYESKKHNTQEAHEAIRITHINDEKINTNNKIGYNEIKLYNLIRIRTIASQMQPAVYKIIRLYIDINPIDYSEVIKKNILTKSSSSAADFVEALPETKYNFISEQKEILFLGYLKLYNMTDEIPDEKFCDDNIFFSLTEIKKGEIIKLTNMECQEKYDNIPSRYDEASLINELDPNNLNIGRPSTYSATIQKIQDIKYVEKKNNDGILKTTNVIKWKDENNETHEGKKEITIGKDVDKFIPTDIGYVITNILVNNFPEIMEYKFTAKMENDLDKIAMGELIWYEVVDDFYKLFIKQFEIFIKMKTVAERSLGENIFVSLINKKPVIKCINADKTISYADVEKPFTFDNINMDDAIKLIEKRKLFPKKIGNHEGFDIMIQKGKYGYYLQYNKINIQITSSEIKLEDAIKMINDRKILCLGQYENDDILLQNGKFGFYIVYKKKNYSIKDNNISIDDAINIIKNNNIIEFEDNKIKYVIKNGPYGYYIQKIEIGKKNINIKIPTGTNIETLSLEKINEIISTSNNKPIKKIKNLKNR